MIRRLAFAIAILIGISSFAQGKAEWKHLKEPINLFVANDLGRNGYYQQKPIAEMMGEMAEVIGPEAILALGDIHHFNGIQSIYDPLWMTNYESVYSHPELMIDWFPVCGNHEYRGNTQAVMDYSKLSRRWEMPAKYYSMTFKGKGTSLKIIFIDTTPLIEKYREAKNKYPDASSQDINSQLLWLENELANAQEDWVIVAGHHPIFADTPKDELERKDMQKLVNPILLKHKPDMYICGHIHNFQHIKRDGIDYIVNSSGSLSREKVKPIDGTMFTSGEAGFSVIGADKSSITLSMIDNNGNVINKITRKK